MNATSKLHRDLTPTLSDKGKARLLSCRGEPLFLAGWERTLFIHYEVPAEPLQRAIPFALDLRDGKAYISLVAFTMRDMRFRVGGPLTSWWLKPIATHHFLNVRTYVKHGNEPGIHFLTEFLSNWLSVQLGPLLYGLPYQYAHIDYEHNHELGRLAGDVTGAKTGERLAYRAECAVTGFAPCEQGSLDEFLVERYTAYTAHGKTRRFFRIWHPPWPQIKANVSITDDSLIRNAWPWFAQARMVSANYSPGFSDVWMGRAQFA